MASSDINEEIDILENKLENFHNKVDEKQEELRQICDINDKLECDYNEITNNNIKLNNQNKLLYKSIDNLKSQNHNSLGFKFSELEITECISESPLQSLNEIKTIIESLVQDSDNKNQIKQENLNEENMSFSIHVRYLGDVMKTKIFWDKKSVNKTKTNPNSINNLKFIDILNQACEYFEVKKNNYVLKDKNNSIWILNSNVIDFFISANEEKTEYSDVLILYLINKKSFQGRKNDDSDKKKEIKDKSHNEVALGMIENVLENGENDNNENVKELAYDGMYDQEFKDKDDFNKRLLIKQVEINKVTVIIEKTFGKMLVSTFLYALFVIVILIFLIYKEENDTIFNVSEIVKGELIEDLFEYKFNLFNYNDNLTVSNRINLKNSNDLDMVKTWISEVLIKKLNLVNRNYKYDKKWDSNLFASYEDLMDKKIHVSPLFINKYSLVGKMRIFQTKRKFLNKCDRLFDCQNYDDTIKKQSYYSKEFLKSFEESEIKYSYNYFGQYSSYSTNIGFVYDIPLYNNINDLDLEKDLSAIKNVWLDELTEYILVSFNFFTNIKNRNNIYCVSIHIEQSVNGLINTKFTVNKLKMFFDLNKKTEKSINYYQNIGILESKRDLDQPEKGIVSILFSEYFFEVVYLFMLFVYSVINLIQDLIKIKREYKYFIISFEFSQWVVSMVLNIFILVVLIVKVTYIIMQLNFVNEFKLNGFKDYIPVDYYIFNYEYVHNIIEIVMITLVLLNITNIFYKEFYLLIIETFNNAKELILSYYILLTLYIMTFSISFWIIFQGSIREFKTFIDSLYNVLYLMTLDNDIILKMMNVNSFFTIIFTILYILFLVLFMYKLLYILIFESFVAIKEKYPLNLLDFTVVLHGVKHFIENVIIKLKSFYILDDNKDDE